MLQFDACCKAIDQISTVAGTAAKFCVWTRATYRYTAALHCGHSFIGGILTGNGQ